MSKISCTTIGSILCALQACCTVGGAAPDFKLTDKTLVAWVALADTVQQAGSALTLLDDMEHFDAIVFAEREPGKWMAGSDFFRRTEEDQSAYPLETADASAFVQMAVSYQGDCVTLYRNGVQYAQYGIKKAQRFDSQASVLLGLRYKGAKGEIGFLAGAIDEARIYTEALDASALAALRPGSPAGPKPLAQWTFEDGKVADATGTYPEGALHGAARIEDGKLLLDGKSAYAEICRPRVVREQGMFYKARSRQTGNMWDTWLYYRDGMYYLYYLANSIGGWDNVSMATSPDGVHFTEIGRILAKDPKAVWMGTGSTWKSPNFEKDGKYFINFSQQFPDQPQTIFFGESTDLIQWEWLDVEKYEFVQDTRWYKPDGRWDCIYTIPRPGGGLYGYWTATPKEETGGRFGFGQSLDGAKWEALEPPKVEGVGEGEAGAVEKIGAKYYMMFGNQGKMSTLVAERPEGPFLLATKNPNLLSGHTYFSRFFPTPDGVLVTHHSIAREGQVYFGPLKSTVVDAEETLRLGWWKQNEKLKDGASVVQVPDPKAKPGEAVAMLPDSFDLTGGLVLEGRLTMPTEGSEPVGLYIPHSAEQGTAIRVHADGRCELGDIAPDGSGFKAVKTVDREVDFGPEPAFRLLLKGSLLEFYLADILIECYSLPDEADGRIGTMGPVSKMTAWQCR